jgi:hypothetical protein
MLADTGRTLDFIGACSLSLRSKPVCSNPKLAAGFLVYHGNLPDAVQRADACG